MKVEIKLQTYDGTPDTCSEWFYNLEKALRRMRVSETDFLLYATANTVGIAKDAITMLEVKHKDEYTLIKRDLTAMFDVTKPQELYENFLQKFKQLHTETVTGFYIKYQTYVNKLVTRNIWADDELRMTNEVSFFRAKLKPDISQQLTILLYQNMIEDSDVTIEKAYYLAQLAEKMVPKQLPLTAAANIQSSKTCFYCGQVGHVIRDCNHKKRNKKPCQKYIDSGIARFGPAFEWDFSKRQQKNKSNENTHSILLQKDEESSSIFATQASKDKHRTVAMILTDIKNDTNQWFNDIPTLIDSGGCENAINANFAHTNGFTIHEDVSHQSNIQAISACGGAIYFNKFVEIEIKFGQSYATERFYLMDNLPRVLLLGFPFFEKTGAILDARAGTLNITDLKQTIPLLRMEKERKTELVFATIGFAQPLSTLPIYNIPTQLPIPQLQKMSTPQYAYIQNNFTNTPSQNLLQNVFGATAPRQRSLPVDEEIFKLQRQQYHDNLTELEYQMDLETLLEEYKDIFDTESNEPARIPKIHVDLKPEFKDKRFFRPEPLRSKKDQTIIDENYKKLIAQGKARLNPTSIHNLGQVIVPRYDKDGNIVEGRARVCIDARPINKALIPYKFPIPSIKKLISDLSNKRFFSEIDLSYSFQQFSISDELSDLLTVTCSFGKVSCTRLTYGVQFATDIFQETMSLELLEFLEKWLMIYVDNFLCSTHTRTEHLVALRQLFQRLRALNIKCRKEKCQFMVNTIRTMGFEVSEGIIKPDPHKIDMLRKTPTPTTRADLKAYLGLLQFYRNMLPHLAHAAHQLYAATSENYVFQWTSTLQQAFEATKDMLQRDILNTNLEGMEGVKVYIDASKFAICIVVTQYGKIVACSSKVLNPSQRRWATIERELYAAAWGLKNMRFYLHGVFFILYTDHKPLLGLLNKTEDAPNNRIMTMLLATTEYSFSIEYIPGIRNILADFGTRFLDISEWDKPQPEDNEGLHELFTFDTQVSTQILDLIYVSQIPDEDLQQLKSTRRKFQHSDGIITIEAHPHSLLYVPINSRRALFWHLHKDLHHGSFKLIQILSDLKLFWPRMSASVDIFLSQCICANKKNKGPHRYSDLKHITASHPLHILALDLYFYADEIYLTVFCIYSRFCWAKHIANKQASTVLAAYIEFCDTYAKPMLLSCDNGGEFSLIEDIKIPHPSEHPQANGIIERFHEELGKMCRIHSSTPDKIFHLLNSSKSTLLLHSYVKMLHHDSTNCILYYGTRKFSYNDLVWRKVPSRKRAKDEDTFTGPHRVIEKKGDFTYQITSHISATKMLLVNLNDIKILHIPDTKRWKLNVTLVPELLATLGSTETLCEPLINFHSIGALVNDLEQGRQMSVKFFVIPDWPCSDWYKPLHDHIVAEAVKLPNEENTFMVNLEKHSYPVGKFPWDHWLFELR